MTLTFKPATRVNLPIPAWIYEYRLLRRCEVDENGCWLWQGPLNPAGYGSTIRAWHKGWLPHRLAFTVMVGPIIGDNQIDHLCRVRNCINPKHLEQVTQAENLRRQGAAVTHCPRNHEYTPENTYKSSDGLRRCRECGRIRSRERARRKKAEMA
ncbi:HNH endonuclease [Mycobacterium phage Firehouse51]|uniref:HNH endonuclease n=3 Tax=Cheoctovirus TaxID=1623281 RepID=A0A385DQI1_9CAUD|nr:HNH endonuclease [Mycobacterium phage Mutaforma13]YP_009956516.1 HNH endonuclease [Mycobacterium phage EleanorGeorge]YP_009957160.1 HNH endonuclease [Mycobacterium phage Firehouse51]AEJ93146.1 HNH endonuclease domain protein [Mycobacterium phage Mutaforma13]AXQ60765.1 HNH endonuclease [Mycobacterium phage EleanorGeorge]QOP65027.1 HNH endonuclease [Mycobacterium phage Firehouse51]